MYGKISPKYSVTQRREEEEEEEEEEEDEEKEGRKESHATASSGKYTAP